MATLRERLLAKIKSLNETVWEGRATEPAVRDWLEGFDPVVPGGDDERLHALYLLSNFVYFGSREVRALLEAMYRDLYKYPIVESIRKANDNTTDAAVIASLFRPELTRTRFLGVGNPAESGCHLLYYFRQENALPRNLFLHTHQVFDRHGGMSPVTLRWPEVTRYVFIDDFCGSGRQGVAYSRDIVDDLKRLKADLFVAYYVLVATSDGIRVVRDQTAFDSAQCLYELDTSFRCFSDESRFFGNGQEGIEKAAAERTCRKHGRRLWPEHPLGYDDCQLLMGFHHNTPDNTLPIIWYDDPDGPPWAPIFRRYPKVYGGL